VTVPVSAANSTRKSSIATSGTDEAAAIGYDEFTVGTE